MSNITPIIGTKGVFVLKSPWVVNPGEHYEVAEIKTLEQLSMSGVDPKNSIYGKIGLIDGANGFSWTDEVSRKPKIIILMGTRGNKIVVPDTYIASYPDISAVEYQRYLISIDLGLFPLNEDFGELANDLVMLATSRTGLNVSGKTYTTPLATQPTVKEHEDMVKARKTYVPNTISNAEEITLLRLEIETLKKTTLAFKTKLQNHGLLPK
jgi:hypothetical protein